ncbi:hypothetical protein F5H01DRAFT_346193 [Linnemannia elongata]|nr:hypothetical protein F5H01DRAFT_346193 [Linnemannia elongata]
MVAPYASQTHNIVNTNNNSFILNLSILTMLILQGGKRSLPGTLHSRAAHARVAAPLAVCFPNLLLLAYNAS